MTTPMMTKMPVKPVIETEISNDMMCLDVENAKKLNRYILDLERGYKNI